MNFYLPYPPIKQKKINKIIAMYEEREFYNIGIAYKKGFKVGVIAGIEIGEEKDI